MASLSSIPRRRVTAAPVGFFSTGSSFSVPVSQRRNHWIYHHFQRVIVSKSSPQKPQEGHEVQGKPTSSHHGSHGGTRPSWWGWSAREDGWGAQKWAFVRRLSNGGPDGGWGDGDAKFTPDKNSTSQDKTQDHRNPRRALISDFLSPDYESRFLTWKEKEQKKLLDRLRKEFEEQEKELLDRQRKEDEEKKKLEWKLWKKEFKEARGFEEALREKEKREKEREKELEKARQMRNLEHVKDANKTVPHPVPVLHPYSQVPIYEKETIDAEAATEVRRKGVDKDAVAYREQKGQPNVEGGEGIDSSLVVEAAGEGVVEPVDLEATKVPEGVNPLSGEGLPITQATDSPALAPPVSRKVGEGVPEIVLPELGQGVEPPNPTQIAEEKLGEVEAAPTPEEVGDAPLLIESTGESADQGLRPVEPEHTEDPVADSASEISSPNTESAPELTLPPPPPLAEEPIEEPVKKPVEEPVERLAEGPVEEPAPSAESAQKVEEVVTTPSTSEAPPATPLLEPVTSELSQIKESLSQVTNVISKLDNAMDYELNSILIQLRLWRREVEKLASTSGMIPPLERKLFISDVAETPESAAPAVQSGPMEYKILTLSPTPPHHLLTTDLNVANTTPWAVGEKKNISNFLPNLKEPYLFLQRVPKLTAEGWEIVSGGAEMLILARKPVTGALHSTTAVASTSAEPTAAAELTNPDSSPPPAEVRTVFESSPTHGFVDQETGTILLKPGGGDEKKRLMYNVNDDGHLHFYGHGLGGIAGDGVSFSGVNLTPRVNPIDMTMQFESSSTPSTSEGEVLESHQQEVDHAWDEKRTNAVRSMREGLRLGEKAQEEAQASVAEVEKDVEEKGRIAEEERVDLEEIKAVDNPVHGQASVGEGVARETSEAAKGGLPISQEEVEQGGQQKKKGGRVGRFFKRLGWTMVWLGATVVVVKEIGYWSQKAEEKKKVEAGGVGRGIMGKDGLGAKQIGEGVVVGSTIAGERWGGSRPGSRYSWSERESVREGRWGSSGGRTWGGGEVKD